jgi:peptidyl-prolyl cis-trans isomerase C
MKNKNYSPFIAILTCLVLIVIAGCNSKEEKPKAANNLTAKQEVKQKLPQTETLPPSASSSTTISLTPSATAVEVDGKKLTQGQLDKEIKNSFAGISAQVPADHAPRVKEDLRKKLINDFIMRTLLSAEVNRKKISVTEAEVTEAINQIKASLPPGVKIEDIVKKNHSTEKEMREEVSLGIKINKMVLASLSGKIKPTEKEITEFYQKNKDKLKVPESVHTRHILIATPKTETDKTKAEKRVKAEGLRKQLLAGADFADLAKKNSDCPSKEKGGDLGNISRGQMVKPFEDAAFSQKKDAIGPVVETDFGYHIIQVLQHNEPQTLNLDDKIKAEIASFLEREKMQKAFASMLERLKAKATIIIHGQ